jgi:hypothetical protein
LADEQTADDFERYIARSNRTHGSGFRGKFNWRFFTFWLGYAVLVLTIALLTCRSDEILFDIAKPFLGANPF